MTPRADLSRLSHDEHIFREARFELVSHLNDLGYYGCIVYADSYKGNGLFTKHLYPIDAKSLTYEERDEVQIDSLYDKTKLYPTDLRHITDVEVGKICNDKYETYKLFSALQPKTLQLNGRHDLIRLQELNNESGKVVIKSLGGFGGKEVLIDSISNLQKLSSLPPFPLIAQKFIETSYGIPGLVSGRHDVRVLILNGKIIGGSVRTPGGRGYLSNTSRGGIMRPLEVFELPSHLTSLAQLVDKTLPDKPRFYAADFMYSRLQDKWFLVELNSAPGFLPTRFGSVGARSQQELAAALMQLA